MPSAVILPAYVSQALAASHVGTWRCSIDRQTVQGDETLAAIWGVDPARLRRGLPFADLVAKIHPDDRVLFDRKGEAVRARGGHIVMELRMRPGRGTERWVLFRGRYDAGSSQSGTECVGFGIAIDVTEAKRASGSLEPLYLVSTDPDSDPELTPLQTLAGVALSLHEQIAQFEPANPAITAVTELLLLVIGQQLAREVDPRDLAL